MALHFKRWAIKGPFGSTTKVGQKAAVPGFKSGKTNDLCKMQEPGV